MDNSGFDNGFECGFDSGFDGGFDNGRAERIAQVEAEWAQRRAMDREVDEAIQSQVRDRKGTATSVAFSVRLDRAEVLALTRRAELIGIPPSALARNLIRMGVKRPASADLSAAVAQLEDAVAGVRALVP